jgi:Sap, sulfolipid-1-addressing protein
VRGARGDRHGWEGVVELAIGLALLLLALRIHRRPERAHTHSGRSREVLDRLRRVRPATAVVAGLALGVGGPKRLVLTGLAAASITAAGVAGRTAAALVLWYCALATVVVWAPVLAAIVAGQRAVDAFDAGFRWLTRRQRPVTVAVLGVVASFLVVHGIALFAG